MMVVRQFLALAADVRDFVGWCFIMVWPMWRGGLWQRIGFAVLPYAGGWAYRDDPYVREVRAAWIKTGAPLDTKGGDNG